MPLFHEIMLKSLHWFEHMATLFAFIQRLLPFSARGNGNSKPLILTAIYLGRVTSNEGGHSCVKHLDGLAKSWIDLLNECQSVEKLERELCLILWRARASELLMGGK